MKKQGLIFIVSFCLISLKSIQIYSTETGTRNLALNRTAYHSSAKNFVNVGHMVTDGNSTITRWESKTRSSRICPPEWVYVDLGKVCLISRVVLKWEHAYAVHYKIEISTDSRRPQNWTSVYSTIYGDGDIDDIFFEPVNARYVRMYATKKSTGIQYSLWEFEVYGKGNFKRASIPNSPQLPDGRLYLDSN